MQTIAIIGGSGFIGSHLARSLSFKYRVKILDVRKPSTDLTKSSNVEFVHVDVRYYDEVLKVLRDVDLVIHTAIIQIPRINQEKRLGYEVNIVGTHNVAQAVDELERVKGMILTSSWHVLGEVGLSGTIDESFGYRPDKVEKRARLYVFSKIAQEIIMRFHESFSDKIYFIVRLGTVLGEGMPEKTAANIFISNALQGKPITPYKHVMYRPMFYVDVDDVVKVMSTIVDKILSGQLRKSADSLDNIVTVAYPKPITILDLAHMIRELVIELSKGRIKPPIEIIDTGVEPLFSPEDKYRVELDLSRLYSVLGEKVVLTHPRDALRKIISRRIETYRFV